MKRASKAKRRKPPTQRPRRPAAARRKPATRAARTPPSSDSLLPVPTWIARKRDGGELDDDALRALVAGAAKGTIPDYQVAAFLMAVVWRGMSPRELGTWLLAMIDSGDRLHLDAIPGLKVDKHSTGGVGDKISLCLAPLVAACGVPVPMISGRSLGHTGGTLDKLEAIPGFRTALTPKEFARVLGRTGLVLAGQSERLCPADRILYALRDATATVESIPLIASSILSKKIAEGADALVMDVKVGSGAFLPEISRARELARTIVALGRSAGLKVTALLTAMDQPLGRAVGNACEVAEAIDVLRGQGPEDTRALTLRLGTEMLLLGGRAADIPSAARKIEEALGSGAGLERFRRCIEEQGGDPRVLDDRSRLPRASRAEQITAGAGGWIRRIDAGLVGRGATLLGVGRQRKEDRVDPGAEVMFERKVGDPVEAGECLAIARFSDARRWAAAKPLLEQAIVVAESPPNPAPLVLETIS